MRSIRSLAKGALLLAGAAALTSALTIPANADPNHPVNATDITAVGSDTIQFLGNNLAEGPGLWNSTNQNQLLDSWDAVNPTSGATHDLITIKPGVPQIQRPNGSNEGIAALQGNSAVDVARSSRGPQAGDSTTTGSLLFLPIAQDNLNYASKAGQTDVPDGLTTAQLTSIYNCSVTNWSQLVVNGVPGPNAPIHPLIPQPGSGTRSFFLGQLNLANPGSCATQVEEHDPAPIAADADAIAPFSAARFVFPTPLSGQIQLNKTGFAATRSVYLVARNDGTDHVQTSPANLQGLLGDGQTPGAGFVCSAAAQAEVAREGFVPAQDGVFPGTGSICGFAEHI